MIDIAADPSTLLTYAVATLPAPAQVNSVLQMQIDASSPNAVTCTRIVVTIPVGTNASDLIATATIEAVPPAGWAATQDGEQIIFTPPGGSVDIKGEGLVFGLSVTTNDRPGTANLLIDETASDPDNVSGTRSLTWAVAKYPPDFTLSALTAVPPTATDIVYGDSAVLGWTATGAGVTCTLGYQPANSGTPVSVSVPNTPDRGSYTSEPLTRSDSVTFTLIAQMTPDGQDQPLTLQSQLTISVEALTLTLVAEPPAVGTNGLVRLRWTTNNADYCTDENGTQLPASGTRLVVLAATHDFVVNAFSGGQQIAQQSRTIVVDPSIVATESGFSSIGANGADFTTDPPGNGQSVTLTATLPPLDKTDSPTRVIPITATGGNGGLGTVAAPFDYDYQFRGGTGGDASMTATTDEGLGPPAQYLIMVTAGAGGMGSDGNRNLVQAPSGTATATLDGIAIALP